MNKICEHEKCSNPVKRPESRFCSLSCANSRPKENKKSRSRICTQCSNDFECKDYRQRFCSQSCAATFNNKGVRRHGKSPKKCPRCENPVSNPMSKHCSELCHNISLREIRTMAWLETGQATIGGRGHYIRQYIFDDQGGLCAICEMADSWQGKKLVFILDHIDGNAENNHRDNLRLVCPNCDSQLPTYKSKNKGNGRHKRRERYKKGLSY